MLAFMLLQAAAGAAFGTFGAAIGAALAAFAAGYGIGKVGSSAGNIRSTTIIVAGMIEGACLLAVITCLLAIVMK